jgi:hypothetical protein
MVLTAAPSKIIWVEADRTSVPPTVRRTNRIPNPEPTTYLSISGIQEWTLICNSYPNIWNTTTHLASRSRQFFLLGCFSSPRNTAHSVRICMYLYHGDCA